MNFGVIGLAVAMDDAIVLGWNGVFTVHPVWKMLETPVLFYLVVGFGKPPVFFASLSIYTRVHTEKSEKEVFDFAK